MIWAKYGISDLDYSNVGKVLMDLCDADETLNAWSEEMLDQLSEIE